MKHLIKFGITSFVILLFSFITYFPVKISLGWLLSYSDVMHELFEPGSDLVWNFVDFLIKWSLWLILISIPLLFAKSYIIIVFNLVFMWIDDDGLFNAHVYLLKDWLQALGAFIVVALYKTIYYKYFAG